MKQKEEIAGRGPVLFVQRLYPLPGQQQQRFVPGQFFLGGIPEVGKQAKLQVIVPVCQEPDLQGLGEMPNVFRAGQHGRDHHQSRRFRRNPLGKVHSRQQTGCDETCRKEIDQCYGEGADREKRAEADESRVADRAGRGNRSLRARRRPRTGRAAESSPDRAAKKIGGRCLSPCRRRTIWPPRGL